MNVIGEVTAEAATGADAAVAADRLVIELAGVTRSYPGNPPVHAVREVSLRVRPGELLAVVGPSGSGKSTLLNLIGTLDRPSAGRVRIAGYDVDRLSDRELSTLRAEHIGFVFQQFFLSPGVSALDNVGDGLLYTGASLRERRRRAARALEQVGLSDRIHHQPNELSGGQRQRVAVARALVGKPSFLLADEPTGALDSFNGERVMELLTEAARSTNAAVVLVTHEARVAAYSDREIVVRDGRSRDMERAI